MLTNAEKMIWAAAFANAVAKGSGTSGDFANRCAVEAHRAVTTFRYAQKEYHKASHMARLMENDDAT